MILSRLAQAVVLAVAAFAASPATAQTPAQVERSVGPWELSNPSGQRKCDLEFRAARQRAGAVEAYALAFGPRCREAFPATSAVIAWSLAQNGNLVWLDANGHPLFDFGETEVGIFEALRAGDPIVYFLTNLGLVGTALPLPEEVAGRWGLGRPGQRPACTLVLRDTLAPQAGLMDQRFGLEVVQGCERSLAALGFSTWRLERELLLIEGANAQVLTFKRDADGRWLKVPPDNRPLALTPAGQ